MLAGIVPAPNTMEQHLQPRYTDWSKDHMYRHVTINNNESYNNTIINTAIFIISIQNRIVKTDCTKRLDSLNPNNFYFVVVTDE